MTEESKKIIDRLRVLRLKKGMSQQEVADALGILQGNIARIEHGKHNTGIDIIAKYARLLGHEIDLVEVGNVRPIVGPPRADD